MIYQLRDIAEGLGCRYIGVHDNDVIEHLKFDSRRIQYPSVTLFFAIKTPRRDGHDFIGELVEQGVRNFVVSDPVVAENFPEANFLVVKDVLQALQQIARAHREKFDIPVIGITGSNGKTIVKEWLYQLLHAQYSIVRSPKSYNSQIGVPVSVWLMNRQHDLAIFEAGISAPGEMQNLQQIIQPEIGILTNIGEAHSEGFASREEKTLEKLVLLKDCKTAILNEEYADLLRALGSGARILSWGEGQGNSIRIVNISRAEKSTSLELSCLGEQITIVTSFIDDASIENIITCCCTLIALGIAPAEIPEKMKALVPVNMRMELKKGINGCTLINDSYSADMHALEIALAFLDQQSRGGKKTVIISDILYSDLPAEETYQLLSDQIQKFQIDRVIGIGPEISSWLAVSSLQEKHIDIEAYESTEHFVRHFRSSSFRDETILIKGARAFAFEDVAQALQQQNHQTLLEINLSAIAGNLKAYQQLLKPDTRVMAMVKAFAYGSGAAEIAAVLQFHKIDYLGVAYADEGVELRKAGITVPVMVMNPEKNSFDSIVEYNLEPELYSFEQMHTFHQFLQEQGLLAYPVHIEIETGMNRLGFDPGEAQQLIDFLLRAEEFRVKSVFTHLVGSEEPGLDEFTAAQFELFKNCSDKICQGLPYPILRHIANSAAAVRHPKLQMDMIRLGIGLYGVDSTKHPALKLQTVATLRSTVAQVKEIKKGESVSYNRKAVVQQPSRIATIRLGYADGYPRKLGNGKGKVWVKGKLAPVIGTVCMDMFMADVSHIPSVTEGDDVIIFGEEIPVTQLAEWADTIPYEIMTGVSQRVKRIYYLE